jgi:hypothetical protein
MLTNAPNNGAQNYLYHPLCKVCNATDVHGKYLRDEVDALIASGEKNRDVISWLSSQGMVVTERNFSRHLTKHSPFAKRARCAQSTKSKLLEHTAKKENREVGHALQRIINIGDVAVEEGEMPVTEKLYMEAIKETRKREMDAMNIRDFLEVMEKARYIKADVIEGELA